jgi:hypothetical protein
MNVHNVLPKFWGTAEESKDMWRLKKVIMKPVVVLAVGAVGTFGTGTVFVSATTYCCCFSDRENFLPQYLQDLRLEQMGTGLKIFIRLKTGNIFHILSICTYRLRLSVC